MNTIYHGIAALPLWREPEIRLREAVIDDLAWTIERTLRALNNAWRVERVEAPMLTPRDYLSSAYGEDDIFATQVTKACQPLALRPETTPGSYAAARLIGGKLPLCVWQTGKSFRVESNDGASASKLRFHEFWQGEWQCIYRAGSHADYRAALIAAVEPVLRRHIGRETRVVPSDRIPAYAESTLDIEAAIPGGWREIASCSIRTDYAPDARVAEIAVGLDRVVALAQTEAADDPS